LAYSSSEGTTGDNDIFTIGVGGGAAFNVTENDSPDFYPDYSPDGKRIAYSGTDLDGLETEIYTIDVGGGIPFRVTNNTKDDEDPSYSPDGKKIAYTGYKGLGSDDGEDFDSEIYTINVGGGGKSQVTDTAHFARDPSWGSKP